MTLVSTPDYYLEASIFKLEELVMNTGYCCGLKALFVITRYFDSAFLSFTFQF